MRAAPKGARSRRGNAFSNKGIAAPIVSSALVEASAA